MLEEPKSLNDSHPGLMHDKMAGELCGFARNSRPQCLESVQVVQKALMRFAADLEKYILPSAGFPISKDTANPTICLPSSSQLVLPASVRNQIAATEGMKDRP
jgi:hypothetical protein